MAWSCERKTWLISWDRDYQPLIPWTWRKSCQASDGNKDPRSLRPLYSGTAGLQVSEAESVEVTADCLAGDKISTECTSREQKLKGIRFLGGDWARILAFASQAKIIIRTWTTGLCQHSWRFQRGPRWSSVDVEVTASFLWDPKALSCEY